MPRYIFVIIISILTYARRSDLLRKQSSNDEKHGENESKEYDPDKWEFPLYPHQNKDPPSQWDFGTKDCVRDQVSILEAEPGFKLTEEEKAKFNIWPFGIIPYYIDTVSFDHIFREMLRSFLEKSSILTGLYFYELQKIGTHKQRYVFFINRRGVLDCPDYNAVNFTNKGVQKVIVGYNCFSTGMGPGSMILALAGVPPMHRAPDRDKYIKFSPENTIPDKVHLFDILPDNQWLFHDITYDWQSAGHYIWHKYTTNGQATIAPKMKASLYVGESKKLSCIDLWKIRMLYNFKSKKRNTVVKSQCLKMFRPGSNFKAYSPISDDELTPRMKPNKFAGITDAIQHKPNSIEVESIEDRHTLNDTNNSVKDVIGNHQEALKQKVMNAHVTGTKKQRWKTSQILPKKTNKMKNMKLSMLGPTQNPILGLSDFDTEENDDWMMKKLNET